jgi:UDP-2-acetamido-2-deoxy-ribo-hexuluronate aminotransferase
MKNAISDAEIMTLPVQLVFDTNILVDMLLARGHYYQYAVQLLDKVASKEVEGWYAPHSITTVYYLAERTLAVNAENRAQSEMKARKLVQSLIKVLKPLPQVGDEILEIDSQPGDDYEDELIAHLAAEYLPNPLIITRDKWFLQTSKTHSAHPKEIIENGFSAWLPVAHKIDFIDLATQQRELRPQIERNIHRVLAHGQYIMGCEIGKLEEKLANYTQTEHCIAVSSGTDALLIAMMALGIGAGDEVITTPFTFIATGEMIALLGAKAVFVDIDPKTYNLDANKIEQAITPKTKAIMPVSLYGQCADYDAINTIAAKYHLPVIEDGCQSFGATYKNNPSCGLTTIGCTSFFPSKPLGGYGDSGACFTNDANLAKVMREIRVHGQDRRYHHPRIGINGRMDTLQAAILLAKLDTFPQEVAARAEIGANYTRLINEFKDNNFIIPPYKEAHNTSVYAQYTIQTENRTALQEKLTKVGIPTAVHYPVPLHQQPALKTNEFELPISESLSKKVMSLPMHPYLSKKEQMQIVGVLFQ